MGEATEKEKVLKIGDAAPGFSLPAADGKTYALGDFKEKSLLVVIFSCNHCPYVQAYEDRIIAIQCDYAPKGVQVAAINSNDDQSYPEDGMSEMIKRSTARHFNFPYLRDATQAVARVYGATHTPQIFVFDRARRLQYTGKIDDDWRNPEAVKRQYLREALDTLLAGHVLAEPSTFAIGCTIKWAGS